MVAGVQIGSRTFRSECITARTVDWAPGAEHGADKNMKMASDGISARMPSTPQSIEIETLAAGPTLHLEDHTHNADESHARAPGAVSSGANRSSSPVRPEEVESIV